MTRYGIYTLFDKKQTEKRLSGARLPSLFAQEEARVVIDRAWMILKL